MTTQEIFPGLLKVTEVHDFDLQKTFQSGQCFRWCYERSGAIICLSGQRAIKIKQYPDGSLLVKADLKEWNEFWVDYFDMAHDYSESIWSDIELTEMEKRVCRAGHGIHILHQDPWEVLVSFILTQNCHVSRAHRVIWRVCSVAGASCESQQLKISFKAFPTPQDLIEHKTDIRRLGFGYRDDYIFDAAVCVEDGTVPIKVLQVCSDRVLEATLQEILGVGPMIASSTALFGFRRRSAFPVDMWVSRAIDQFFGGVLNVSKYGKLAGLMQQYLYYCARA